MTQQGVKMFNYIRAPADCPRGTWTAGDWVPACRIWNANMSHCQDVPAGSICENPDGIRSHHCMNCGSPNHPRIRCELDEPDKEHIPHSMLNARGPQEHNRIQAERHTRRRR